MCIYLCVCVCVCVYVYVYVCIYMYIERHIWIYRLLYDLSCCVYIYSVCKILIIYCITYHISEYSITVNSTMTIKIC